MDPERAIKRGALSELNTRKQALALSIAGDIRAVKQALALASVTPIESIDLDDAAVAINRAQESKAEYLDVLAKIAELKEELGD